MSSSAISWANRTPIRVDKFVSWLSSDGTRLRVKISPQLPLFFPFLICSTPFCLFVCLIIIEYSCTLIVFRGEITCMYRRVPKGEKTNWPLFRTVWLPYFCSCHFSRFWVGEVFLWEGRCVYVCLYACPYFSCLFE